MAGLLAGVCCATSIAASQPAADRPLDELVGDYAACIVQHHHGEARAYLLSSAKVGSHDDRRHPRDGDCRHILLDDNVEVSFRFEVFQGALALALVHSDFAASGPEDLSDRPPLAPLGNRRREDVYAKERNDFALIGDCMSRADASATRRWLVAQPGSADDAARTAAVLPLFQRCSRSAVTIHRLYGETARGPIALSYSRLAYAPSIQPTGTVH